MLFAAECVSATHSAFEHAKEILDIVCRIAVLVHILIAVMQDRLMVCKLLASKSVEFAFVSYERGFAANVCEQDIANLVSRCAFDGECTSAAR